MQNAHAKAMSSGFMHACSPLVKLSILYVLTSKSCNKQDIDNL